MPPDQPLVASGSCAETDTGYAYGMISAYANGVFTYPQHGDGISRSMNGVVTSTVSPTGTNTSYANFSLSGQPQSVTTWGVTLLADSSHWADLTQTATYDNYGELLTRTDLAGHLVVTNTYDFAGRLIAETTPTAKKYKDADAANSYAVTKHYAYDGLGNLTRSYSTSSDSTVATPRFDDVVRTVSPSGWLLSESFRDGVTNSTELSHTDYTYDGEGRRVAVNDSNIGSQPARTDYGYHGNVVASWHEGCSDYDYHHSKFTVCDTDDRKTVIWSPGGDGMAAVRYALNADGSVATETHDGVFRWTQYSYDAAGRVVCQRTPTETYSSLHLFDLSIETDQYDLQGNLLCSVDPGGVKTTYQYDAEGRQVYQTLLTPQPGDGSAPPDDGTTGLDNAATQTVYNQLGWVLAENSVNDVSTATNYNNDGSVASHTEGDVLTQYTYNEAGQALTQSVGSATTVARNISYSYDGFGELTEQISSRPGDDASQITVDTSHDTLGRVTHTAKTQGATSPRVIYDQTQAYFKADYPGGILQTTVFGQPGAGSAPADGDTLITQKEYIVPGTGGYSFTAQRAGQSTTDVSGSFLTRDDADNVTSATFSLARGSSPLVSNYTYDCDNRLVDFWGTGMVQLPPTDQYGDPISNYVYSSVSGRLMSEDLQFVSNTNLFGEINHTYTYDPSGRVKKVNDVAYTFNGGGALTKIVNGSQTTTATYTQRQRLTKLVTTGAPDTVVKWNSTNGRRVSQGTSDTHQTLHYNYLADGLLGGVVDDNGSSSSYTYDGDGQRLSQTVNGATTTNYTYDGLKLLALHGFDSGPAASWKWSVCYLYDAAGWPYAGYYEASDGVPAHAQSQWFAIITNLRGDVTELLDQNGNRFASYRYSVWGAPQGASGAGIESTSTPSVNTSLANAIAIRQPLRYAGYVYDSTSGLYYVGARYYDPQTTQFISRDPAKADGAQSAYQYAQDNPVLNIDPSGLYLEVKDDVRAYWNPKTGTYGRVVTPNDDFLSRITYLSNERYRPDRSDWINPQGNPKLTRKPMSAYGFGDWVHMAFHTWPLGWPDMDPKSTEGQVQMNLVLLACMGGMGDPVLDVPAPKVPSTDVGPTGGNPPGIIYRGGSRTDLQLTDNGSGVSFRAELSNPLGQPPVLRPGEKYFGVDTSQLPPGSVVYDNVPAGHVSVLDTLPQAVRDAIIELESGRFPK